MMARLGLLMGEAAWPKRMLMKGAGSAFWTALERTITLKGLAETNAALAAIAATAAEILIECFD